MDEQAFRQRLAELPARPCPFALALQSASASCSRAGRIQLAEREVIACNDILKQQRCAAFHRLLRQNFTFALGVRDEMAPLTHGQSLRVVCGGLCGLARVVTDHDAVDDVDALLRLAEARYRALSELPYSAVVHAARTCYRGRRG